MSARRVALIAAAGCAAVFIAVMVWDLAVESPRLAGSQICAQDAESARLFGADGPGVFKFDRSTGLPVRIPASMALAMVAKGTFNPAYPGQRACGLKALTQTGSSLLAAGSLLGAILAVLIGLFVRGRN